MAYRTYSVELSEGQRNSLRKAFESKSELTLRLKNSQLRGNFPLLLTEQQISKITKAIHSGTGVDIRISKIQMRAQEQNGGFLGALFKTVLPMVTKVASKVLAPLATGAVSALGEVGVKKMFGQGIVKIPKDKEPSELTLEECVELAEKAPEKKARGRKK